MKKIELSWEQMQNNLKRNKKLAIIIIVFFLMVGLVVGMIEARQYPKEIKKEILELPPIDYTTIPKDAFYYDRCFSLLQDNSDEMKSYLAYMLTLDLQKKSEEELLALKSEMASYQTNLQQALDFNFANHPTEFSLINEKLGRLKVKQAKLEEEDVVVQEKIENLGTERGEKYTQLRTRQEEIIYEKVDTKRQLKVLPHVNKKTCEINIKESKEILKDQKEKTNGFLKKFHSAIAKVAEREQYIIRYKYQDTSLIFAKSTYGLDSERERFFAFMLFFLLVGIAVAAVVAVCRGEKHENQ